MKLNNLHVTKRPVDIALAGTAALLGLAFLGASSAGIVHSKTLPGMELKSEFVSPGLECELAGLLPDPGNPSRYLIAANQKPVYAAGQKAKLPVEYRGKLLAVNRADGRIAQAFDLTQGQYGGMVFANGNVFVSSLDPPEILKLDPADFHIVKRIAVSGPIGGLGFDAKTGKLIAQLYTDSPRLETIDPATGAVAQRLWSDESAMDLKVVNKDWLCTWVSGFDPYAYSELRRLDPQTGRVKAQVRLPGIYTSLGSLPGQTTFLAMVTTDRTVGTTVIREHSYDASRVAWR